MDTTDYYRQLGLRLGASLEAVKTSYRQLARQYHPDVNPGNEVARDKFMAITEAYKFLLTIAKSEAELAPVTASKKPLHRDLKFPNINLQKLKSRPKVHRLSLILN